MVKRYQQDWITYIQSEILEIVFTNISRGPWSRKARINWNIINRKFLLMYKKYEKIDIIDVPSNFFFHFVDLLYK